MSAVPVKVADQTFHGFLLSGQPAACASFVPRVVARVNHPKNEWMFDVSWGVDVAVSTPRMLSALVEEAVSVGDLVRLFTFRQGEANLVEITLSSDSPVSGQRVGDQPFRSARGPARPFAQPLRHHHRR